MIDRVGQMLSAEFSRLPCFSVLSYYTTWQLQSANAALQEMHYKYDMQFALTGSMEIGPKRIMVFLQLVKVETEMLIWSDMLELDDTQHQNPDVAGIIVSRIMTGLQKSGNIFDAHPERLADRGITGYKNMYRLPAHDLNHCI
jgi:TolB-like protein